MAEFQAVAVSGGAWEVQHNSTTIITYDGPIASVNEECAKETSHNLTVQRQTHGTDFGMSP